MSFAKESKLYKPEILAKMIKDPKNVKEELHMIPIEDIIKDTRIRKALLIDSPTQAGKTGKTLAETCAMVSEFEGSTLVLFITQANSTTGASQVKQRASKFPGFDDFEIRYAHEPAKTDRDNQMVIGFWNSRNTAKMMATVKSKKWENTLIVIDECDSGNLKGIHDRLCFVDDVDRKPKSGLVTVIFVTATIANLSYNILRIATENEERFKYSVVDEIVKKRVVEHQFAQPPDCYVGASWFQNTPGVWKKLEFGDRDPDMTTEAYERLKDSAVLKEVRSMTFDSKELTLFVTSSRTADHSKMSQRLVAFGYNVMVEMNNSIGRDFQVRYYNGLGDACMWNIPFKELNALADSGVLSKIIKNGKKVDTGINSKDDLTMPHILQAALFMGSDAQKRIRKNVEVEEYLKLKKLFSVLDRPDDYPEEPRVALIAGNLATRGITFQNPAIDFVCTSFCFTDTKDAISRGAANTQRFGRACGMLDEAFKKDGRKPILIATKGIVEAAVANEATVMKKSKDIPNGELLSLKELVTAEEWKKIKAMALTKNTNQPKKEGYDQSDTQERLTKVSIAYNKKGIMQAIIKMFVDNGFKAVTDSEVHACNPNTKVKVRLSDFTKWEESHNRVNIIEEIGQKWKLRNVIKEHLNL